MVRRGGETRSSTTDYPARFAAASLAISAGANVLAVSRMLGHENAQVTLRNYTDLFDADLDKDTAHRRTVSKRGPKGVSRSSEGDWIMSSTSANTLRALAVAEGFEPSDGGYPSHAFEACSLGRSDTPPPGILRRHRLALLTPIAGGRRNPPAEQRIRRPAPRRAPAGGGSSRRSRTTSHSEPTAPVLGSQAPNTSRSTRAITRAPAHIVQGSTVTASVAPVSRHPSPRAPAAARDGQHLGVRGRITQGLAGIDRAGQLGSVGADHHRTRPGRRRGPAVAATASAARIRSSSDAHRPRRSSTADSSSAKPISRAMRPSCSSA